MGLLGGLQRAGVGVQMARTAKQRLAQGAAAVAGSKAEQAKKPPAGPVAKTPASAQVIGKTLGGMAAAVRGKKGGDKKFSFRDIRGRR